AYNGRRGDRMRGAAGRSIEEHEPLAACRAFDDLGHVQRTAAEALNREYPAAIRQVSDRLQETGVCSIFPAKLVQLLGLVGTPRLGVDADGAARCLAERANGRLPGSAPILGGIDGKDGAGNDVADGRGIA